jgi:hypothetical protein
VAARATHEPGALVHFRHWDAVRKPKDGRPGVVDRNFSGNLAIFYGSTFKRGGYPQDAIEINPRANTGTRPRDLADHLPGFVDEPTFFHGSLVAETPLRDPGLEHIAGLAFPNDLLEDLQEQAEERVLGFVTAWRNMAWLAARSQLLDALWWRTKLDTETETMLTLVLCDGWSINEVEGITWGDLDLRRHVAQIRGAGRWLLPHTAGLLAEVRRGSAGNSPWTSSSREEMIEKLRQGWGALVAAAKPRGRRSPFPSWDQLLVKIDR